MTDESTQCSVAYEEHQLRARIRTLSQDLANALETIKLLQTENLVLQGQRTRQAILAGEPLRIIDRTLKDSRSEREEILARLARIECALNGLITEFYKPTETRR